MTCYLAEFKCTDDWGMMPRQVIFAAKNKEAAIKRLREGYPIEKIYSVKVCRREDGLLRKDKKQEKHRHPKRR